MQKRDKPSNQTQPRRCHAALFEPTLNVSLRTSREMRNSLLAHARKQFLKSTDECARIVFVNPHVSIKDVSQDVSHGLGTNYQIVQEVERLIHPVNRLDPIDDNPADFGKGSRGEHGRR